MDSYCTRCLLQFDNMNIYNMHLSIVHKENVEIKQKTNKKRLKSLKEYHYNVKIVTKSFLLGVI